MNDALIEQLNLVADGLAENGFAVIDNFLLPSEVKSIVETLCNEKLAAYLEQNPGVARAILGKVVAVLRRL